MEDLINFDVIEEHKENIQSLPGGRSAKSLASTFAPPSLLSLTPTPGHTRNLNDTIRQEFELEIIAISDSDDPLDIYDRYIKWTLSAYPSAQATPESQLRPLLERATKAFQTVTHYKNDPRYLKLWLTYIHLFSDAPKETFAYLARHGIGESLALFYEEFAAWLEGADRWTQADEVYRLGIAQEARPTERLVRKFGEFQLRFGQRVQTGEEPSSPALPTVRPALVAKLDPFSLSTPRSVDSQTQISSSGIGGLSTSRATRQKLAVFSDVDASALGTKESLGETAKGWENIGSIAERKKENVMGARPWAGETLRAGKRSAAPLKMTVFKDESDSQILAVNNEIPSRFTNQQQITNSRTGKIERVFVNLEAVYPNPDDHNEEMSFEELRAKARGWTGRDCVAKPEPIASKRSQSLAQEQGACSIKQNQPNESLLQGAKQSSDLQNVSETRTDCVLDEEARSQRSGRPKKLKIKEVRAEVQTIKTNLESPTGPKLKRKNSVDPTMTLHTKAATSDILDIFNQPLRNVSLLSSQTESAGESDYDDDDYTSAGESTGTGRISGPSEFGEDEPEARNSIDHGETDAASESIWSDFTASKHVPKLDMDNVAIGEDNDLVVEQQFCLVRDSVTTAHRENKHVVDITIPVLPDPEMSSPRTKYIPLPPEDCEVPSRPFRDSSQAVQNRLPFMTPIVERTESSMGAMTILEQKDYFNSRTPSRWSSDISMMPETEDKMVKTPSREIFSEARAIRPKQRHEDSKYMPGNAILHDQKASAENSIEPSIKDNQCNPVDEAIRKAILDNLRPPLTSYNGFFDHRPLNCNKGLEIRKYVKAAAKASKSSTDKTTTTPTLPPTIRFPQATGSTYTIKRELGKGAFAPVYLIQQEEGREERPHTQKQQHRDLLSALKCEHPPTCWEFYIMTTLHSRLPASSTHPSNQHSLLKPHALHLFADEGYLLEEYLEQGTLLNLVNLAKSDPQGVLDEVIAMFFTVELLRTVESMHSAGILHGDLKADNCLVRLSSTSSSTEWDSEYQGSGGGGWAQKGLCLIDFGRGIDLRQFIPEVQFVADWKTAKSDCAEMREMRPWTWQVDYWGIAGVAHSLLFGKYIEDVAVDIHSTVAVASASASTSITEDLKITSESVEMGLGVRAKRWKLKEPLKRYWQTELWADLFDALLNPAAYVTAEEGSKMPITRTLRTCRQGMEGWLEREGGRRGLKSGLRRLEERIREQKGR
ncbi:hypothetical protein MMC07_007469 [Pseudocyphellaria aurata]|nr:hypothetical protein [Pseudocyphellaria aurata]